MRLVGQVAHMKEIINAYKVLVGKPKGTTLKMGEKC
jgi:hypothetical protein